MKQQLLDTWRINQRMNLLLLDNISEAGFAATQTVRGRTIFQQWIHIHNVRVQWIQICAPCLSEKCLVLDKNMPFDKKNLRDSLELSAECIATLLSDSWENGGNISGFKKGVIPFLGYFISHESHHRGNMLLTLKLAGEKIPDAARWGLWDWGK